MALAAVVALLLPAANVVSLDVIGESPSAATVPNTASIGGSDSAARAATDPGQSSRVAASPTDSAVTEYDLTDAAGEPTQAPAARRPVGTDSASASPSASASASASATATATATTTDAADPRGTETAHPAEQATGGASTETLSDGRTQLTAAPQTVGDFGTVGVTWDADQAVSEDSSFQVRTETNGAWSDWSALEYHDEHGPDADSAEAQHVRPGTDPMVVGRVNQVQVRTVTDGTAPNGLRLAVVDSKDEDAPTAVESPALDTAALDTPNQSGDAAAITLQAAVTNKAKQPVIYSRAQWGANEKIRDASSLRYGTITGGFVHHTVNGNDYAKDDVPGILRSIYTYHVKSRGWSDVGYNFLIDKFGRIWEGRYGGISKAVVGAHTLNYNDYSFAASAIGNYETAKPSEAMVNAYAALFAWKLGANGVSASAGRTKIGRTTFAHAINGHRDAASTACPGRYLYARVGDIRTRAAALQAGKSNGGTNGGTNTGGGTNNGGSTGGGNTGGNTGGGNGTNLGNGAWTGAAIKSSLLSASYPDLIVVRSSDRRAMIVPTGGLTNFAAPRTLSKGWGQKRSVQVAGDLTGDKKPDMLYLTRTGVLTVSKGRGNGAFKGQVRAYPNFSAFRSPRAAGDLTGDGKNDMIAWGKKNGRIYVFPGKGNGTFGTPKALGATSASYTTAHPAGDLTGDGKVDLLALKGSAMYLHPGKGNGTFASARRVAGSWGYRDLVAGVDFTRDGKVDLLARDKSGKLSVFPGRGNGTFGPAYGPTTRAVPTLNGVSSAGNLVGGPGADLIGRQGDALVVVSNADTYELGNPIDTGRTFASANVVINAGDWDRDGKGDVITRSAATGDVYLWRGTGGGKLATGIKIGRGSAYKTRTKFSVVGDVTGDGLPDMVASGALGKNPYIYPGNGAKGFKTPRIAAPTGAIMKLPVSTASYDWVIPVANLTRSSAKADVVAREKSSGRIYVLESVTGYTTRRLLSESMAGYTLY